MFRELREAPNQTMIHIGQHIQVLLRKENITVTKFAELLHCTRPNVYKIFAKRTIDIELLWRISEALNHDFFADISLHYLKENPTSPQPDIDNGEPT